MTKPRVDRVVRSGQRRCTGCQPDRRRGGQYSV